MLSFSKSLIVVVVLSFTVFVAFLMYSNSSIPKEQGNVVIEREEEVDDRPPIVLPTPTKAVTRQEDFAADTTATTQAADSAAVQTTPAQSTEKAPAPQLEQQTHTTPTPQNFPHTKEDVLAVVNDNLTERGIAPIDDSDHYRGNLSDPALFVITYGDLESPFTLRYVQSMFTILQDRNDTAWIYRHMPLARIHNNSENMAVASECIARLGGNDKFWLFINSVMITEKFDVPTHMKAAEALSIDTQEYLSCWGDLQVIGHVNEEFADATKIGARGAPHSEIITATGETHTVPGAMPTESMNAILDALVK